MTMHPLRILAVDDDDVDRDFMVRMLNRTGKGYLVETAQSIDDARSELSQSEFDCVLLDYNLNGLKGLDLDAEFLLGLELALIRKVVEAVVVEPPGVSDDAQREL